VGAVEIVGDTLGEAVGRGVLVGARVSSGGKVGVPSVGGIVDEEDGVASVGALAGEDGELSVSGDDSGSLDGAGVGVPSVLGESGDESGGARPVG
jgi:hypothetical protein